MVTSKLLSVTPEGFLMKEYDFEAKVPVEHVMHIISAIRGGTLTASGALICTGSSLGELGAFIAKFQAPFAQQLAVSFADLSIEEVCDELERKLTTTSFSNSPSTIDPAMVALIIQLVSLLFKKFF